MLEHQPTSSEPPSKKARVSGAEVDAPAQRGKGACNGADVVLPMRTSPSAQGMPKLIAAGVLGMHGFCVLDLQEQTYQQPAKKSPGEADDAAAPAKRFSVVYPSVKQAMAVDWSALAARVPPFYCALQLLCDWQAAACRHAMHGLHPSTTRTLHPSATRALHPSTPPPPAPSTPPPRAPSTPPPLAGLGPRDPTQPRTQLSSWQAHLDGPVDRRAEIDSPESRLAWLEQRRQQKLGEAQRAEEWLSASFVAQARPSLVTTSQPLLATTSH